MSQASFYCPRCKQYKLFTGENMNHTPHILAAVFLCGLWLPIWLILAATYKVIYRCSICGYTAGVRYLQDPNLAAREKREHDEKVNLAAFRRQQIAAGLVEPTIGEKIASWPYLTHAAVGFFFLCIAAAVIIIYSVQSTIQSIDSKTPTTTSATTPTNNKGLFVKNNFDGVKKALQSRIKMRPKWDSIDFRKIEDNGVTLALEYKSKPTSLVEVKNDTDYLANIVLDYVRSQGINPRESWFALFVHAQRREPDGVRRYGKTSYDFSTGNLSFSEAGSFY